MKNDHVSGDKQPSFEQRVRTSMHCVRSVFFVFLLLPLSILLTAQQMAAPDAQAAAQGAILLQQADAAARGTGAIRDVTLTGNVRHIAGSDDETGTAVLKALATGEMQIDLTFSSGRFSEVRANSDKGPIGKWSGTDGTSHNLALHNMMADNCWFFPPLLLQQLGQSNNATAALGPSADGALQNLTHLSISRQFANPNLPAQIAKQLEHAVKMQVYLDPSTLLPAVITYNTHPDNNALRDIPVQIRFSDYREVNGARVPFHVEKLVNGRLVLDLNFETAVLNAGLSASSFNAQ
jgi:hypothetical protein